MIWRLIVLSAVVVVAWVAVAAWERRPIRGTRLLSSGLTLVTGADCRLCPLAVAAADGAGIDVSVVDVSDFEDSSIRSLPTALVADRQGIVIARKSGRAVIASMPELISMARSVA